MKKVRTYEDAWFSVEVLTEAIELFWKFTKHPDKTTEMSVRVGQDTWTHDDLAEFMADYRKAAGADFSFDIIDGVYRLRIAGDYRAARVLVEAPGRSNIEQIFAIFDRNYEKAKIPKPAAPAPLPPPRPTIFIGHGAQRCLAGPKGSSAR